MTPSRTRSVLFARVLYCAPLALVVHPFAAAAALPVGPVEWPVAEGGNGHLYEYVIPPNQPPLISWTGARDAAAAAARSQAGMPGHLATITSDAERLFLATHFSSGAAAGLDAWIGGFQPPGMAPAAGWTWITGEPWSFTAWRSGEPNDSNGGGDEQYLSTSTTGAPVNWLWNDNRINGVPAAYFVEYEPPLPEPTAAAALFAATGLALMRRRRK
jgi:hypothetical protein